MFVIKLDKTFFKFLETTSFRFVDDREKATIFSDYAHAESVVKSLAAAGINRLAICVHLAVVRAKIPKLRVIK